MNKYNNKDGLMGDHSWSVKGRCLLVWSWSRVELQPKIRKKYDSLFQWHFPQCDYRLLGICSEEHHWHSINLVRVLSEKPIAALLWKKEKPQVLKIVDKKSRHFWISLQCQLPVSTDFRNVSESNIGCSSMRKPTQRGGALTESSISSLNYSREHWFLCTPKDSCRNDG
jgi:hypothetical protein